MRKRDRSRTWKGSSIAKQTTHLGREVERSDHGKLASRGLPFGAARLLDRFYPPAQRIRSAKLDAPRRHAPLVLGYSYDCLRVENRTGPPARSDLLAQLLLALADPRATFLLGAGASAPQVPVGSQIAREIVKAYSHRSYSFGLIQSPPLVRFIRESGDNDLRRGDADIHQWMYLRHQTADSLGVQMGQVFERAANPPPELRSEAYPEQYRVFRLFARSAKVVTFNWDGLDEFCPQEVIAVHGRRFRPRLFCEYDLAPILGRAQLSDESDGKWLFGNVTLPYEQGSESMAAVRERVSHLLLRASVVVVIGYRFGLGTDPEYDREWRDVFVKAMRENPCAIHVVDPDAAGLCGALSEEINRRVNLFSWPLYWDTFAKALLDVGLAIGVRSVLPLMHHCRAFSRRYHQIDTRT